jgi:hypothetical protein
VAQAVVAPLTPADSNRREQEREREISGEAEKEKTLFESNAIL